MDTSVTGYVTLDLVIRTFRHKGLRDLFETGRSGKISANIRDRCRRRLDVIDNAKSLEELNLPGYRLHRLEGVQPPRYAVDINGPWRITFEWDDGDAFRVDLEQYH